jgi:alanyl-tRNA synthetase
MLDAPINGAESVTGRIEWSRRFDHMQQHTGQHVLSRAFIETAELHTVSFHMGEETCTIDLEGRFSPEAGTAAEALANRIIWENRPVGVRTVPVGELDAEGLRRKVPEGVTDARLVEVADFDVIPCCGTHVRATGELGAIKVLKWEKVKGGNHRVHFVAGARALADYALKHDIASRLAGRFTTAVAEVEAKVEKLSAEHQAQKKRLRAMSLRLAAVEAAELLDGAPAAGDVKVVTCRLEGDGDYARAVSTALKSSPKTVAVLGAADGTVVCSVSDDVELDIAAIAVPRAKELGGSGGGKGAFAQLKLPGGADVKAFIEGITEDVRSSL